MVCVWYGLGGPNSSEAVNSNSIYGATGPQYMRIALITGACTPGACGVGDYTRCLAQSLNSLGAQADVVSDGQWGVRDVSRATKNLEKLMPDIIHVQYPTAGFGYRLGPQVFAVRTKSVVTLHEV